MCFEGTYEGGEVGTMRQRRILIESDPKRQEAKNKKKLARLKKKMEVMQQRRKKKEARDQSELCQTRRRVQSLDFCSS